MRKGNFHIDTVDTVDTSYQGRRSIVVMTPEIEQAPLSTRVRVRLGAHKLDREVVAGVVPMPGSPLEVHTARLTSVREREGIARALRQVVDSVNTNSRALLRVPMLSNRIGECRDVIDDITMRLHSPRPVHPVGMARLRILLSDGTGPLYCDGGASLEAELRDALAAL